MHTTLHHTLERQKKLLRETISRIVESIRPEKIICYGSRHHINEAWTIFDHSAEPLIYSDYDILIVTDPDDKHKDHELLEKVNNHNKGDIHIVPVAHDLNAVNEALQQGSRFFNTVCSRGIILYDRSGLPIPLSEKTARFSHDADISYWKHHFGLANQFLAGAYHYQSNDKPTMSVFMLHQAVEHACIAIIHARLGYRATTHNLNRLLGLTENISSKLFHLFPQVSDSEIELFKQLVHAYGDVRYRQKFTIPGDQAETLYKRVKELVTIIERLYHERQITTIREPVKDKIVHDLPHFEHIGMDTFANIVLQKGEHENVRIEPQDVSNAFKITVEDKRLSISTVPESFEVFPETTVYVSYTTLSGLVTNYSGKVTCTEPIEASLLGIIQNGRGNIDLTVDVLSLDVTLIKTGNVKISGSANETKMLNTGTGSIEASSLETSEAKVTIKGSGSISIHVEEELSAILSGTGDLLLKGNPRLKSLINESGKIKKLI